MEGNYQNSSIPTQSDLCHHLDSKHCLKRKFKPKDDHQIVSKRGNYYEESTKNERILTEFSEEAYNTGLKQIQNEAFKQAEIHFNDKLIQVKKDHELKIWDLKKKLEESTNARTDLIEDFQEFLTQWANDREAKENELTKNLQDSKSELKKSENEIQHLKSKLEEQNEEVSRKVSQVEDDSLRRMTVLNETIQAKVQDFVNYSDGLRNKISSLENTEVFLRGKIVNLTGECETKLNDANKKLNQEKHELQKVVKLKNDLQNQLDDMKAHCNTKSRQIVECANKIKRLEAENQSLNLSTQAQMKKLQSENDDLKIKLGTIVCRN